MPQDPDTRRAVWAVLVGIITAAILGWCSLLTTYALAHRERIVSLERATEHDRQDRLEIKAMLRDIQCDLKEHLKESRR